MTKTSEWKKDKFAKYAKPAPAHDNTGVAASIAQLAKEKPKRSNPLKSMQDKIKGKKK